MNPAAEITVLLNGLDGLWLPAVDALIKVTLVLGVASVAALVLGRASAAMRHLVWTLALTSALVLPGPLCRASPLAVTDCHADTARRPRRRRQPR